MTEEAHDPSEGDEAGWLKDLRRQAKEADKLRQEVTGLRRQIAMDDAGIPKTGAGKLFRKTWDGDPDDLEGLKAAAAEYELIPTTESPTADVADAAIDAAAAISEITQPSDGSPSIDALLGEANTLDEIERIARDAGFATSQP